MWSRCGAKRLSLIRRNRFHPTLARLLFGPLLGCVSPFSKGVFTIVATVGELQKYGVVVRSGFIDRFSVRSFR
jgi:hypothetical protein